MLNETPLTLTLLFRPSTLRLRIARVTECMDDLPPALAASSSTESALDPSLHGRSDKTRWIATKSPDPVRWGETRSFARLSNPT